MANGLQTWYPFWRFETLIAVVHCHSQFIRVVWRSQEMRRAWSQDFGGIQAQFRCWMWKSKISISNFGKIFQSTSCRWHFPITYFPFNTRPMSEPFLALHMLSLAQILCWNLHKSTECALTSVWLHQILFCYHSMNMLFEIIKNCNWFEHFPLAFSFMEESNFHTKLGLNKMKKI